MTSDELYLLTYHKFNNLLIPSLPEIIFASLIEDKDKLIKLLNLEFNLNDFINYLIINKTCSRVEILKALETYLKKRGEIIF